MQTTRVIAALLVLLAGTAPAEAAREGPAAAPGNRRLADFTLPSLDGEAVSLRDFRGRKPVLLVFWASWCPECMAAIPEIKALHDGPAGGRLQILALDFRESREKVAAVVKSHGIRYPVLLDERGTVARDFGIVGIPTYIVVGKDGAVAYRANVLPGDLSAYL